MVNNRQRKAIRKSKASAEDQAQHDRIKNLLNTLAPLDSAANPPGQHSNTSSRLSTSNNSRKRRISVPARRQPSNTRPKRNAKASAVRVNHPDKEEVVSNPSSQASTSGSASDGPRIRDRQAQVNKPPGIVRQEPMRTDNPTPKRNAKPKRPIKKIPENIVPEQEPPASEVEDQNVVAPESQQPAHEGPDVSSEVAAAVSIVQAQQSALIFAPPTPSAEDVAAPRASEVIPPFVSEASALTQSPPQQPHQNQAIAPATPTAVVQLAVVHLDRPQCPVYLNAERAALFRLPNRSNNFRTWNARDVYEWLRMLPNQSAAFKALREKLLEYDGSGDFLNQLLSGPESVKSASEMLNASILHCHSIKRHVAALENFLLETEYKEAVQKYEQRNN
ncbi:Protein CBG00518 [Caenorhabditis briggsae]|uniref:Protein CBG00518 n=1 Tax=Caenorhabditis briggsae TaxID=6238 RepID=A8WNQ1_CAEBR|nr:Protein CBG00518 [Caenorhabditis briggsae]CAP22106.2 Protein CBG00518 [Caenorhabditis briggsae]